MELKILIETEFPMHKLNDYTDLCKTIEHFDRIANLAKKVKQCIFMCRRTDKTAHILDFIALQFNTHKIEIFFWHDSHFRTYDGCPNFDFKKLIKELLESEK
jgi:hypothetical protein